MSAGKVIALVVLAGCTQAAHAIGDAGSKPHDAGDQLDAGGDSGAPVPRGARILGLDILATTPASSFQQNLALARQLGVGAMSFPYDWNQLEPDTPLECDAGSTYLDPLGVFAGFEALLPDSGMSLSLTLRPVNTNQLPVPVSLSATAFDGVPDHTALLVCRFERLLDYVLDSIPDVPLTSFQIGNEIDSYPGATTQAFWSSYQSFFSQVAPYARSKRPGLRVGLTSTFGGLVGRGPPLAQSGLAAINQLGDLVGVTYYPIDSSYDVLAPSVAGADLAAIVEAAPAGLPVYVEEVGYPSSSGCDSSDASQADFVDALFAAWDEHAERVPYLSILRLNDLSDTSAAAAASAYSASPPPAFVDFLESMGLQQYDGGSKPALIELRGQTAARGW